MRTPIADFVKEYAEKKMTRFHMPGHKGKSFLGCEAYDITEVKGADALYEADGIIAESEANAAEAFGTERTVFSTEGSSQCIRAMLHLAVHYKKHCGKPYVLAARNVHKAFLYSAALVDFDVEWLFSAEMHSLCSCKITPEQIEAVLSQKEEMPAAVYLTSPDYLGGQADIKAIADVCHKYGTILAVDNAHGAYLHFLEEKQHPIDLGADICCDSAHKTLPVLTGGAYLQISKTAPEYFAKHAKQVMALYGSTSPSYLILSSLDLCNHQFKSGYQERLAQTVKSVKVIKERLRANGWMVEETEPLKIVIKTPEGMTGQEISAMLREKQIECEYADEKYLVCMISTENSLEEMEGLVHALGKNIGEESKELSMKPLQSERKMSIREAMFAVHEIISVDEAEGRICGSPTVSCPPAIPIVVSGELITKEAISMFRSYGIEEVEVIK